MTRPKGKLFALLAIFAAIGIITATGAFTSVTAERTATVAVTGDSAALLGLQPGSQGGSYVTTNDGEIEISLGSDINLNASTKLEEVLNITNNGNQAVGIWIDKAGDNPSAVKFYNGTTFASSDRIDSVSGNHTDLGSGESIQVSIDIDTVGVGLSPDDGLISTIEIHADSTLA